MLSRPYRFPLSREFKQLKKTGRLTNGPLFAILVKEKEGLSRFGFVVSKLIDKRATVRHRVKRLLAEAVRLNLEKIKPGCDVVFLTKKSLPGKTFRETEAEVLRMMARAGLGKS